MALGVHQVRTTRTLHAPAVLATPDAFATKTSTNAQFLRLVETAQHAETPMEATTACVPVVTKEKTAPLTQTTVRLILAKMEGLASMVSAIILAFVLMVSMENIAKQILMSVLRSHVKTELLVTNTLILTPALVR